MECLGGPGFVIESRPIMNSRSGKNTPSSGVCVATGFNGLIAVDIDTDDSAIVAAILHVLPQSPVSKKGAKGKTLFYRGNVMTTDKDTGTITGHIASTSFDLAGGRVLDILAHGK
jgi:hypothetical protein